MRTTLACGCYINDATHSTVHAGSMKPDKRSKGDVLRNKQHWPLPHTPENYCISCDRFRPCTCDVVAQA